jgi:hypothetical protein
MRTLWIGIGVAVAVVGAAGGARAGELPQNALSLQLPSLFASGIAGQYERAVLTKFSLVAGLGLRSGASGDFDSRTVALGGEARVWIREDWNVSGPYVGARLDVARFSLRDEVEDRLVGKSWSITESLQAGWRFRIRDRVEITPSIGFGVRQEVTDGGPLASWSRGALLFGLTAGALF